MIEEKRPNYVAKVEVVADNVIAKYINTVLGEGRDIYLLRPWDPEEDIYYPETNPPEPPNISWLLLEFGEEIGQATIKARKNSTTIDLEVSRLSVGIGEPRGGKTDCFLFDESYIFGPTPPVQIVDSDRNILAIVTHRSVNSPIE